ncbi:hypothetical protein ACN47E_006041 [Coniothyrium glycines]
MSFLPSTSKLRGVLASGNTSTVKTGTKAATAVTAAAAKPRTVAILEPDATDLPDMSDVKANEDELCESDWLEVDDDREWTDEELADDARPGRRIGVQEQKKRTQLTVQDVLDFCREQKKAKSKPSV